VAKCIYRPRRFRDLVDTMSECVECGEELKPGAGHSVCGECASTNLVELYEERGETVDDWTMCPLCEGSGRCFYCSPGGPCYHCSGSGREQPGSDEECHICSGGGNVGKGCQMCAFTRKCGHCAGTGKVPSGALMDN
jgi:DnaJ-class molecular chaperone